MNVIINGLAGAALGMLVSIFTHFDVKHIPGFKENLKGSLKKFELASAGVTTALLFIILYKFFDSKGQLISYCIMACVLVAAAIWDIKERIIPDRLIILGTLTAICGIFINDDLTILRALIGGVTAGGIFLIISLITKGGVGMGDVKLLGCVGLFLGIEKVLSAILISVILSGFMGVILFIVSAKNRKKTMPFAPFILAGTILAVLL